MVCGRLELNAEKWAKFLTDSWEIWEIIEFRFKDQNYWALLFVPYQYEDQSLRKFTGNASEKAKNIHVEEVFYLFENYFFLIMLTGLGFKMQIRINV